MSTLAARLASMVVKEVTKPAVNMLTSALMANQTLRHATVTAARVRTISLLTVLCFGNACITLREARSALKQSDGSTRGCACLQQWSLGAARARFQCVGAVPW